MSTTTNQVRTHLKMLERVWDGPLCEVPGSVPSTEKNKSRHFLWDFHSDTDSGSTATPSCRLSAMTQNNWKSKQALTISLIAPWLTAWILLESIQPREAHYCTGSQAPCWTAYPLENLLHAELPSVHPVFGVSSKDRISVCCSTVKRAHHSLHLPPTAL